MKLLVAVDMEGITGVSSWDHVSPEHPHYIRFRQLMTADVNAAVQGAVAGGADEVIIADGHGNGQNVMIEALEARAALHSGNHAPFAMVNGIDTGVDAVFLVGYHARAGSSPAVLDHTWSSSRVFNAWLNGRVTGEIGLNASLCGHFGAPVLMISGDQTAAAEAAEWIPGIEQAVVKQATSRYAAIALPPEKTGEIIRTAAEMAVRRFRAGEGPQPVVASTPVTVTVEFTNSGMAASAALAPGARRLEPRKVEITSPDMPSAYLAFRTMVGMADK
ncbi:MAG TPA: M55 family metallopeptidase [Levilinea sp.]|nr:M55 family metallopeptidase [Levilinea sp.]